MRLDMATIHATLSPDTRSLMDVRRFGLMKPTAYLVNSARGAIVDGAALYAALSSGQITGAGLNVLDEEPIPPGPAHQNVEFRLNFASNG